MVMKLSKIMCGMKDLRVENFEDYNIDCLSHNSKEIIPNAIFFCLNGGTYNGADYVDEAIKNGAKVVVSETAINDLKVCNIVVSNVRRAMSIMAKNFYGKSDEKLQKIAIVGTNGKTTTTYILANILRHYDKKVGVIGTNGVDINGDRLPLSFTTPDPIELHYIFSQMVAFGVEIVVMEVSAHAIYYDKIWGVKFDLGIFTNISNEHLDFFGDMDNYANVKMSIFNKKYMKEAAINIDDDYGVAMAKSATIPVVSYGIYGPSNFFAVNIKIEIGGSTFVVNANDEIINIRTKLVGEYNIYNILAAIAAAKMLGVEGEVIKKSLLNLDMVDGRFMVYELGHNKKIIVDFAHTPDGFDKVLSLTKKLRKGKITVLFGCVGYSDKIKRGLMGGMAAKYGDKIVVTTDNIGKADFDEIYHDITLGVNSSVEVIKEYDREKAILDAYHSMEKNETLLLLGKGVEDKQVVGDKLVPYSDVEVVKKILGEDKCN